MVPPHRPCIHSTTTDAKADAVRQAGDAKADKMEDRADMMSPPKSN